jgi:hypothetical protein
MLNGDGLGNLGDDFVEVSLVKAALVRDEKTDDVGRFLASVFLE